MECQYNSLDSDDVAALRNAVTYGRGGLGTVIVFSAGNEFATYENMNAEGYVHSRYVISVGAIAGDNEHSLYASAGACLLISAPGGDTDQQLNMYETLPVAEGECRIGGPNVSKSVRAQKDGVCALTPHPINAGRGHELRGPRGVRHRGAHARGEPVARVA